MINAKYSFKSLAGQNFVNEDPADFTRDIIGSDFFQQDPKTKVFPDGSTCRFLRCILDNCVLPAECSVDDHEGVPHSHKQLSPQNDMEYWVLDNDTLKPIEPLKKDEYIVLGKSIDPADIPSEPLSKSILEGSI